MQASDRNLTEALPRFNVTCSPQGNRFYLMVTAHKSYRGAKVTFSGYNLEDVRPYQENSEEEEDAEITDATVEESSTAATTMASTTNPSVITAATTKTSTAAP